MQPLIAFQPLQGWRLAPFPMIKYYHGNFASACPLAPVCVCSAALCVATTAPTLFVPVRSNRAHRSVGSLGLVGKGRQRSAKVGGVPAPFRSSLPHCFAVTSGALHYSSTPSSQCLPMPPNASQCLPMPPNASQCRPAQRGPHKQSWARSAQRWFHPPFHAIQN